MNLIISVFLFYIEPIWRHLEDLIACISLDISKHLDVVYIHCILYSVLVYIRIIVKIVTISYK